MNNPETIKLTAETHDSIVEMMNSIDLENRVVALNCIENVDFSDNLVYILLLKKQGNATTKEWREHAPHTSKMLISIGINLDSTLTWKAYLEILAKRNTEPEKIQFYLDRFVRVIHSSIKALGYDFIEELEITLKRKTKHGEQIGTISTRV
jgi:hypothetical protein